MANVWAAICPGGYIQIDNTADALVVLSDTAPDGYTKIADTIDCDDDSYPTFCTVFKLTCTGGITAININDVEYPLYDVQTTNPSLAVRTPSGAVCYGNLTPGTDTGLNVNFRGTMFHLGN